MKDLESTKALSKLWNFYFFKTLRGREREWEQERKRVRESKDKWGEGQREKQTPY